MTEKHVALCSGGKDSVAATHAAMTHGPADEVVFLHTGTDPDDAYSAIDATIDWIRDWCQSNGWEFTVAHTTEDYEEIVEEDGYPGPGVHYLMYRRLKDRAIEAYKTSLDNGVDLYCWTGIRRWESENRMEVAEPEGTRSGEKWYWRSPLVDWTDERRDRYLDTFNLEPCSVVEEIGRSADCWCGCFGDPQELLDLEAAGFEEHADYLRNLTTPDDCPREQDKWAGYNWSKSDFAEEDPRQATLCSSCDLQKTAADGGETDA